MSEQDEDKPAVWGQLGTRGVTEHRKGKLRQRSARADVPLLFLLIPAGLLLITHAVWWGIFKGHLSVIVGGEAAIGATALVAAMRIMLGCADSGRPAE